MRCLFESERNALLAYYLHLSVEGHEQHLDLQFRMFLVNDTLELFELRGVRGCFDLGLFGVLSAER